MAGIDWGFVEQLILVLFGFALGFGAQGFQQWKGTRSKRKNLAMLLALEVRLNKEMADGSAKKFRATVDEIKKAAPNAVHPQKIIGYFHRTIFNNSAMDFTLFDPTLSSRIIVLYEWLGYADGDVERCNEISDAMMKMVDESGQPLDQLTLAKLKTKEKLMMGFMENYAGTLEQIVKLSTTVLTELNKITTLDFPPTSLVAPPDVTTDGIHIKVEKT